MKFLGPLCLLMLAVGCRTAEERHFHKIAKLQCKMDSECAPEEFAVRFESVDQCIGESQVGVDLYAEHCADFDRAQALRCRDFMRDARRKCSLETSDARYEDFCLDVCTNYQLD